MNVKFTQKFLMAVLLGSGILRWLDWIDGTSLILALVFGFGAYISLIVSELQDRLSKIEKKLFDKNSEKF